MDTLDPFSFILIGNIALPDAVVIAKFDIKGSKLNRKISDESCRKLDDLNSSAVYKDMDFDRFIGSISSLSSKILRKKLTNDVRFLESHNIMDYSLFVIICKPISA